MNSIPVLLESQTDGVYGQNVSSTCSVEVPHRHQSEDTELWSRHAPMNSKHEFLSQKEGCRLRLSVGIKPMEVFCRFEEVPSSSRLTKMTV